jgi:hypothetical protein
MTFRTRQRLSFIGIEITRKQEKVLTFHHQALIDGAVCFFAQADISYNAADNHQNRKQGA